MILVLGNRKKTANIKIANW